ncbi:type I-C CRISPR-associated protein Cas5c [bacterium]|nr:type I-C CRISPR-associated protein Cas5c [bacterium]
MASTRSPVLRVRASGPLACFTRPELKVERVSYPVMTPSAARGLLEAILWKPAIRWHIARIHVLKEISFMAFRRNEVNNRASTPAKAIVEHGGVAPVLFADDDRAQRNTIALSGVDYLIDAWFEMTPKAGPEDNVTKFVEMFTRRLEKGQHYHQPYLGCREFIAEVEPVTDPPPQAIDDDRDLGLMLWDIEFDGLSGNRPIFFPARLESGVLNVPADPREALRLWREQSAVAKGVAP